MLQKLPPEINSIYAYVNPIVALLCRYFWRNAHDSHRNWRTNNAEFVYGQSFDQKKKRILLGIR
jgi:hypothetical protein